jgi:hypothetical protein
VNVTLSLAIIAVTCLISFIAFNNARLLERLILWPPAISRQHQYDRLVTYGLVHAGPGHLLVNMFTLFFSPLIEQAYTISGQARLPRVLRRRVDCFDIADVPRQSRQSAISQPRRFGRGVGGAIRIRPVETMGDDLGVFSPGAGHRLRRALRCLFDYMDSRSSGNVNHSAHLWGAAFGVSFTLLMNPHLFSLFLATLAHPEFRLNH